MAAAGSSFSLLSPEIQKWIYLQGWRELRPAQVEAIKAIRLGSRNLVISAPTAAGKTEAAFLPLLSQLLESPASNRSYVIYVSPLKALINDQWQRLERICAECHITIVPWHGDISQSIKARGLQEPRAVFLITPESIEALLDNRAPLARQIFGNTQAVVIDEFHSFIGEDRGEQLISLLLRLEQLAQHRPRRIGLSATLGDPVAVCRALEARHPDDVDYIDSDRGINRSIKLKLAGVERKSEPKVEPIDRHHDRDSGTTINPALIRPETYPEQPNHKEPLGHDPMVIIARDIFRFAHQSNLVFPNTRRGVEELVDVGRQLCEEAKRQNAFHAHHGLLSKEIREGVEEKARQGRESMTICCTSTLEMGIDIGSIDAIFQVGPAPSISSLRQRLGRSGRRGRDPVLRCYAIENELCSNSRIEDQLRETLIQTIATIILIGRQWYEPPDRQGISLCVVLHQLLALLKQQGGGSAAALWSLFREDSIYNLDKEEFLSILKWLGEISLLVQTDSGLLHLSEKAERHTSSFDFYSVFETEEEYQLYSKGQRLGTVPISSMLAKGDFLLFASRRWIVSSIDSEAKAITVQPSSVKGKTPPSGGSFRIHTQVRQTMRQILMGDDVPAYLDSTAEQLLRQARHCFRGMALQESALLGDLDGQVTWLPWVGTRTMDGLRLLICGIGGEMPSTNKSQFWLKCSGDALREAKKTLQVIPREDLEPLLIERLLDQDSLVALPSTGKWSWALPKRLQVQDSFRRGVNLDEAVIALSTLDISTSNLLTHPA